MPFPRMWRNSQPSVEDVVEEHETEEEEETPTEETPPPDTSGDDRLQAILDRQAQMFTQGIEQTVSKFVQPPAAAPDPDEEPIQAPTHAQMREAAEEGDWDKYFQLQAQREAAVYEASMREMRKAEKRLRSEGANFMTQTNTHLVKQQVPDFEEYQQDVDNLADQLGLDAVSRRNPQVVDLLMSTVRGRPENIDKIVQARIDAEKRNRNGDGTTSDVTGSGRSVNPGGQNHEPVFREVDLQAIHQTGKDPNQVARGLGYKDWSEYEKASVALDNDVRSIPKWRRPRGGR